MSPDYEAIRKGTLDVYRTTASVYDSQRIKTLFERPWLDRFLAYVPAGGTILDLGCGTGEPIGGYFINNGYEFHGLDAAEPMIEIAKSRFPNAHWILGDMRAIDLKRQFDGVISWGGFFHLSESEQIKTIPKIARHVAPGGPLLLTIGPSAGEVTGTVGGKTVYHASLDPEDYKRRLQAEGFDHVDLALEDEESRGHSILLAVKERAEGRAH